MDGGPQTVANASTLFGREAAAGSLRLGLGSDSEPACCGHHRDPPPTRNLKSEGNLNAPDSGQRAL